VAADDEEISLEEVVEIFELIIEKGDRSLTILSDCCHSGYWTLKKEINNLGIETINLSIIAASDPDKAAFDGEFAFYFTE
jgi:hypothetical protein